MSTDTTALDSDLRYTPDAFKGRYRVQLHELLSLSDEEIAQACPGNQAAHFYNIVIAVVSEASRKNLAPERLADLLRSIGNETVSIAKLVGGLSAAFA
jgi:hypothetical protein